MLSPISDSNGHLALPPKEPSEESDELTLEELKKLEKILNKLMHRGQDQEKEQLVKLMDDVWEDPTPDLIEGIFHVN